MTQPDYVVIRPAADLPAGFLPERLNGMWFDRSTLPSLPENMDLPVGVAVPSGRFEQGEDGAVAEVWEVRP